MPQWRLEIQSATAKSWHSQRKNLILEKKKRAIWYQFTEMPRHSHHGISLLFIMNCRVFIFIVACTGIVIGWDPPLSRRCLVKVIFQNEIRFQDPNKEQLFYRWGFPCYSVVKNPLVIQETQVSSLGQEDPPEKGMATHSSILAWEIPWTEKPGGL